MKRLTERNAEIVKMALTPDDFGHYVTLQTIADIYGITRQRVEQILKTADVQKPRASLPRPICKEPGCKEEVAGRTNHYCAEHKREGKYAKRVTIPCTTCGMPITRTKTLMLRFTDDPEVGGQYKRHSILRGRKQERWFCDAVCRGSYAGKAYGWGRKR